MGRRHIRSKIDGYAVGLVRCVKLHEQPLRKVQNAHSRGSADASVIESARSRERKLQGIGACPEDKPEAIMHQQQGGRSRRSDVSVSSRISFRGKVERQLPAT